MRVEANVGSGRGRSRTAQQWGARRQQRKAHLLSWRVRSYDETEKTTAGSSCGSCFSLILLCCWRITYQRLRSLAQETETNALPRRKKEQRKVGLIVTQRCCWWESKNGRNEKSVCRWNWWHIWQRWSWTQGCCPVGKRGAQSGGRRLAAVHSNPYLFI